MKAIKLFILGAALLFATNLEAQISVSLNISSPPLWGPVGYTDVRYYYLPDVESYYDVNSAMFIYLNAGNWVHRKSLPVRYRNYDLYHGYKVVMKDYHGDSPYIQFKEHKAKYSKGYHGQEQKSIGNRPEKGHSKGDAGKRGKSQNKKKQNKRKK